MVKHHGPILLDTNVILECHRIRGWAALAGAYRLETVEECIGETQTGYQRRRPEQEIDPTVLRVSFREIHSVEDMQRAHLALRIPNIALDPGEASLWAHALFRDDQWLLCGPDKASVRAGVRLGLRDRLVSLEQLFGNIGYRPTSPLRRNYTVRWLASVCAEMVLLEPKAGN